jgi:diguanylate cyclase (GGDEF)-like protein/PAS domain S-box-containing protein
VVDSSGFVVASGVDADALAAAILDSVSELVAVARVDSTIVAVNEQLARELGVTVDELLGRSALDLIDPVDLPRALAVLELITGRGSPPGTVGFGLRRADGSILSTELTACDTPIEGERYLTVVGRPSYAIGAVESLLDELLAGGDLADTLVPIVELFAWRENGSQIGICWEEVGGLRSTGTGLPPALAGEDQGSDSPWEQVRRTGVAMAVAAQDLPEPLRDQALGLGLCHAQIEPIAVDHLDVPALVTAWTSAPDLPASLHGFAMAGATRFVEMVLRWTDQVARLDDAAHRDPLTGLSNRRAFFDALRRGDRGGTVLYGDLDGFKAVNDGFGHAAGDALLREVARRLQAEIREGDLLARLGGDEFGLLLWDAEGDEAVAIADRLRTACRAPIVIGDATVSVGISVGLAHDGNALGEDTVERADAALYVEKRRTRPTAS